jgi:hypothetical protein
MTERSEHLTMQLDAVTIETYRDRVYALYADVRSWLAGDDRFDVTQITASVIDVAGEYDIDRLSVFAGGERLLEFRPIAAVALLAAGRIDVWGTVDYATLLYFESSPTSTTTLTNADRTTHKTTRHLFRGIDRPGWYWIDVRHSGEGRFLDHQMLFDVLEEISDFEGDRH